MRFLETEDEQGIATHYNVSTFPCVLFFLKGVMIDRLIGVDTIERRMSSEIMRLSWKIGSGNLDSLRRTYLSRKRRMKMVENVQQEEDMKEEKVKEENVKDLEEKVTIVKKKRRQPKSLLDWLQIELEKKHVSIGNLWSLMMGSTRTWTCRIYGVA
mgnify:CR=1 FL=1